MSRSNKLGYEFYPKDFWTNRKIGKLSITQIAIYRTLIDICYMENIWEIDDYCQAIAHLLPGKVDRIARHIDELCQKGLTEKNGDYLIIPSIKNRMEQVNK